MLLDENLDPRFRALLSDHECTTAVYVGWAGLKNGALLATAEDAGFQVLLTGDRKIPHEQNNGWTTDSYCGFDGTSIVDRSRPYG